MAARSSRRARPNKSPRITSYNVCYTKLLRVKSATQFEDQRPTIAVSIGSAVGSSPGGRIDFTVSGRVRKSSYNFV